MRKPHAVLTATFLLFTGTAQAAVTGHLRFDPEGLAGADSEGRIYLYAPEPARRGSSIAHWDRVASPNLLMEPSINTDLPAGEPDLAADLMHDIGWPAGTLDYAVHAWGVTAASPHSGLFDPRPFAGVPGNPATTLGEARRNVFEAMMDVWAERLGSRVRVEVLVGFAALPCIEGVGAVLGSAGPRRFYVNVPGLPRSNVAYPVALASALTGEKLAGPIELGWGDIVILINSEIDEGCLGEGTSFYYGLDGNEPPGTFDLAAVALHELTHGLGFTNLTDETTGERAFVPSIYSTLTLDTTTGRTWDELVTREERARSAVNTRQVVWNGPAVTSRTAEVLAKGRPVVEVDSGDFTAKLTAAPAEFGAALDEEGLRGPITCFVDDDATPSIFDGCAAPADPRALQGKIALVDRGGCDFTQKARHAQDAGALAVLVANDRSDTPTALGGSDPAVTIPVLGIGRHDGTRLREAACPGQAVTLAGGRFEVSVDWHEDGASKRAVGHRLTPSSAWFSFFSPDNPELMVKVVDACGLDGFGSYWFFAAGTADAGVEITVGDKSSGEVRRYTKEAGRPFEPIRDTRAFDTCP